MKQKIHYLFMLLLMLLTGVGGVKAQEEVFYTLTPTVGSNNAYAANCDITINGMTWNVTGNSTTIPWRIGGKSITATDRAVYSKTAMASAISKVELTVGAASSITVNSLKLIVASDADYNNQIDEVSATFSANSTITFTPTSGTEWASNAYYKFVFNVTVSGSSNKFVEFTKAEFYSAGADSRTAVNITEFTAASTTLTKGNTTTTTVTNDQTEWTPSYTYTSSKESVATVDDNGVITAVGKGEATITATLNIAADNKSYKAGETNSKSINITVNNPYHTASFSINGETSNEDFEEGAAITFPTNIADINGKSFVGWTVDAIDGTTDTAPSFINSATMGNGDVTYYAVFATKAEGNYKEIVDVLNQQFTGVTGTSYSSWSNKKATSDAVYAGQSAGGYSSIQLRSTNNNSGVVSTSSGGNVKEISVIWSSNTDTGRKLNIYGSAEAFEAATNLYNSSKQGTLLGTLEFSGNINDISKLTIIGDYPFIGFRSASGAMYLKEVSITWASGTPDTYSAYCTTVVVDNRQDAGISFGVETVEKELKSSYTGEVLTNPNNLQVTYSSSNESVATVSSGGVVTILAEGETVINAAFEGNDDFKPANANYILTVVDSRINPNPTFASESVNVMIGETVDAPALAKESEGVVSYTTSDATIATVDGTSGVVTGVAVGTATITATVAETNSHKGGTASFTVTVKDPNELSATFNFDNDYEELFSNLKGGLSSGDYTKEDYNDSGDFKVAQTATKEGIELTVSPAEEGKAPNRLWNVTPRLRMYSGTLTISAPSASKIKVVTFTGHDTNFNITPSVGTLSGKVWEGDAETVVFTVHKNTQISTIEVAYETTPVVEPGTPAAITAGFYTIKNLGNEKFVNVAGRKTVTFVDETATAPGTVIKVESNEKGQVQVLRSQGVDLPGYAERAMKYVPKIVQLVAEKLGAEGEGNLLGKDGLDAIMKKFNESFDYHLYTEQGEQGVRIYGKTPSMQPVVEFYNDNKANVDAKLPMLEDFINSAINKVLEKTGGSGASILTEFSLHEIWEKMGKTLAEPTDDASELLFLQQVLSNKTNVWDFAYQTAMKYWKPLIRHEKVQQNLSELGDLAQYVEKIEYIRPDVKYYIVQKDGKIDFISQDNTLLKEASSEWELAERKKFTVNFDEQNVQKGKYYTTLYTDFAYNTLPEGVKAMTVTKVAELNGKNIAITETIEGAVPAQTPVLLESATAGNVELTLEVTDGTAIVNLLKGNDWLVNELTITTPQVDKLFGIVHDLLEYENMGSLYDRYVKEYEYLKKRNAGTVNNKYFFGLSGDDIAEASATTNVCQFTKDEQGLAFSYNLEQSPANKAFLPGDKDLVYLSFVGDVNRDGKVSVADVNALVEIVLGKATEGDTHNYDFEAAHVNADEDITIADVTALVNIILGK